MYNSFFYYVCTCTCTQYLERVQVVAALGKELVRQNSLSPFLFCSHESHGPRAERKPLCSPPLPSSPPTLTPSYQSPSYHPLSHPPQSHPLQSHPLQNRCLQSRQILSQLKSHRDLVQFQKRNRSDSEVSDG